MKAMNFWILAAALIGSSPLAEALASTAPARVLRKQIEVNAAVDQVFAAWTTNEGIKHFFGAEANVKLEPWGPYEVLFNMSVPAGLRGSEGCRVLSFIPNEMLSFEWNAPPKFGDLRGQKTRVILLFHDVGNGHTSVELAHAGWGEGEQWDKLYDYFDAAWSRVLQQLKTYIESSDRAALVPRGADYRRIDREVIIPAPREEVWKAFTTESGISAWLSRGAKVELVPGGAYEMYFKPSAPPGQRGIEGTKVLTFLDPEMFSFRGSAPPEFPNVQKNGPIAVYFFTDLGDGRTCVRSVYIGWSEHDPEWDGAHEHGKVSADFVNRALLSRFERGPVDWSKMDKLPTLPAPTK